jgi:hypothetical protein
MGIVGQKPCVELLRKPRQCRERRQIAVHGENAVGRDQRALLPDATRCQKLLGVRHVSVTI